MKLSCLQENLAKGLNAVGKVVGTQTDLPILSNILVKTDEGRLKLSATNLEIGVNFWVGAKIEKEGLVTVPAKILVDYINSLPNKKVNLSLEKNVLKLSCEGNRASINGISAEEFPLIPEVKPEISFKLKSEILKEIIPEATVAAALDESRPVLTGVCLKIRGDQLKLAATDSYRLAERTITLPGKAKKEITAVIPSTTLKELLRIIIGDPEIREVNCLVGRDQIMFDLGEGNLVSRLIDGKFPSYEQIVPESNKTKAKIKIEDFVKAIRTGMVFSRDAANNVKLSVKKTGEIEIKSTAVQVGENVSVIKSKVEGEGGEISFNSKYLLDGLASIPGEEVTLELNDKLNPGVLKPVVEKKYFYIIMPLRS
ncbi:DNA polymerase III subunit beta [Patescibacteria group bacterium]|nr:MAG: DNA polymerase III subunit beta [Patescibacteria group bacterium]